MSQVFSSKFLAVFAVSWLFFGCVESGSDSDGSTPSIAVTPGQGGGAGTPEKPGDSSDNSGSSEDNAGTSGDTHSGGAGTGDNSGSSEDNAGTSGDTHSGGAGTGDPNGGSVNQKQGEPAVAIESERIPNLHRVSDDLYRSGFPREGGLVELESLGVKSILELSYFDIDSNLPDAKTTSLHIVHYPLLPLGIEQSMIFEMFDIYRDLEKPVLVHCYHGSDRTGLFVAIYRILYQNWSKEEAKDELINGGFGYHDVFTDVIAAIDDLDVEALREAVFGKEMNRYGRGRKCAGMATGRKCE